MNINYSHYEAKAILDIKFCRFCFFALAFTTDSIEKPQVGVGFHNEIADMNVFLVV